MFSADRCDEKTLGVAKEFASDLDRYDRRQTSVISRNRPRVCISNCRVPHRRVAAPQTVLGIRTLADDQ